MSGRNATFLLLVVLALFVGANSLYVIKETERGVLLQFGRTFPISGQISIYRNAITSVTVN